MKWIKYQIVCNENENILLDKKIGYSDANLAIAQNEAYNGVYTIEEDDKTLDKEPLAIEFGGTGAESAKAALDNLGGVSQSGGVIKGPLLLEGNLVLTEGVHYGATLPAAGTKGRIFFKVVDS